MDKQEKYYPESTRELRYIESGAGKPVLFLHGGGVRAETYTPFLDRLARKYRVFAPDLPCFGKSFTPGRVWSFIDYAEYLKKFMADLNLHDVAVVGHSYGGGVALNLAAANKRISALVVVNSAGLKPEYSQLKFCYYLGLKRSYFTICCYGGGREWLRMTRDFLINIPKRMRHPCRVLGTAKRSIFSDYGNYENIRVPTLILWGKKDEVFSMDIARGLENTIPNSDLISLEGNHDWNLLNHDEFFRLVDDFLSGLHRNYIL